MWHFCHDISWVYQLADLRIFKILKGKAKKRSGMPRAVLLRAFWPTSFKGPGRGSRVRVLASI